MAAYAALTSLMNIIHQIQHHPSPPIYIEKQQLDSLTKNVTLLQEFCENYHSPVADSDDQSDPLEMSIADAAHAVEDVIESYIVYRIKLAVELTYDYDYDYDKQIEEINYSTFYKDMHNSIKAMDWIAREVAEMVGEKVAAEPQLLRNVSTSGGSSGSSIMVGFDDVLLQILDKLTDQRLRRQVIPIVGMGGIGKTTLARHLYAHPLLQEHFDICAWATISQKYNTIGILYDLLSETKKKSKEELSDMSADELGSQLHKCLFGRRFLIVMDDMWSIEAWDKIQCFFPDNGNRSRIVVTTRLSTLGSQLDKYHCQKLKFLDDVSSWNLLSKTVFGEEGCPTELKEIGKKIVETCKGLPLSIVVMGGVLKSLEQTLECWELIRRKSSSLVINSENEDYCLRILKMSYNHLPVHLKPCFLYMGVFEEDSVVSVSKLAKLWVSEGFVKPINGKSLETAAKVYLNDLVDRNLILIHELGSTGNIKHCKIHDLLRDLGCREAAKEGFYSVIGQDEVQDLHRQRCVVIRGSSSKKQVDYALQFMPLARSILCDTDIAVVPSPKSRMLRIWSAYDACGSADNLFGFVNSRYIVAGVYGALPSSFGLLWNLQTLIIFHSSRVSSPDEIWKMSQLRHVEFHKGVLHLPRLQRRNNIVILENLQTLIGLCFLNSDEVPLSLIIPNIKKLGGTDGDPPSLKGLTKLESYHCRTTFRRYRMNELTFPHSLRKLSLGSYLSSLDVDEELLLEMIGVLPLLLKLKLRRGRFKEWKTRQGHFPSLKYLELYCCVMQSWVTESSHFPRLERLHLFGLKELEEIPSEIGEVATLQTIVLEYCSESAVESAKNITEEQEDILVRVVLFNTDKNQALRSLASSNFVVEIVHFN